MIRAALVPSELRAWLETGDPPRLLDLRGGRSFRAGHLRGAISVPGKWLADRLFLLPPRRRALCLLHPNPRSAAAAAALLEARGFTHLGWSTAGPTDLGAEWLEAGTSTGRIWEPSPFLVEASAAMEPMRSPGAIALDLACGSGRNGVELSLRGWDVWGVDRLPDAIRQARRLARAAAAPARFRVADLEAPKAIRHWLAPGRWDAILCFRYLDRARLPQMMGSLRTGGWFVLETFLEEQARVHGKPSRPEFLLAPGELRHIFRDWRIELCREGIDEEGSYLASIAAQKLDSSD
ncbi:MAG: methyltransferase domain-containing protein [Candidatus Eisenbacteria bacterium]